MYGLLLQNMVEFIQNKFGDNMWKKVRQGFQKKMCKFWDMSQNMGGGVREILINFFSLIRTFYGKGGGP